MTFIWRHLVLAVITSLSETYLFLCLHLLIISDLLFSMLSYLCRAIASFSLRYRRPEITPYLDTLHAVSVWLRFGKLPEINCNVIVITKGTVFQNGFRSQNGLCSIRVLCKRVLVNLLLHRSTIIKHIWPNLP